MKKILSAICATALTASVAVTGALPAHSAPIFVPKAPTAEHSDVVKVQDFRWRKRGNSIGNRNETSFRNFNRGNNWRRWDNDRVGWYNGHRGYRYKRHRGDRYRDGFWFPAGAFIAGAIVGGAIANSNGYNRYAGGGNAHVEWCYDRYRSYRASDNTFQPYNGPRRQCYSPYS